MSDPILLLLSMDILVLLLLGACATALPLRIGSLLTSSLGGIGLLLCVPALLTSVPTRVMDVPVGPPGLSVYLVLDPLSAFLLPVVFLAGTAIAAFQTTLALPVPRSAVATTALCLAGAALSLLAADGVTLAIGLGLMCAAIWLGQTGGRNHAGLLIPLLLLAALCMLTPSGVIPRFDTISAAPAGLGRMTAVVILTATGFVGLVWSPSAGRGGIRQAVAAGVLVPAGTGVVLRLVDDLCRSSVGPGPGFILLLTGGAIAVAEGWRAAGHPDIDGAAGCLVRRQAGLAMTGVGLSMIARAADLPEAAAYALAACLLSAAGASIAGVLTSLAVVSMGASAGTYRLSSLGGLIHAMPGTSLALAAGLLGLSALPPSLGFASLWLLLEAVLAAPRTGGLLFQLPLALTGGAIALSAAVTTAAGVRLIGIAILGRPRSPLAAGAQEGKSLPRTALLVLSGLSVAAGLLPAPILKALAYPAIRAFTGVTSEASVGMALLASPIASPGYLALPVLALLTLTTGGVMLATRWSRRTGRTGGVWLDGRQPPAGLPFGEPAAQSAGEGFLPALVAVRLPSALLRLSRPEAFAPCRPPSAAAGLWVLVAACGVLLLVLAVAG